MQRNYSQLFTACLAGALLPFAFAPIHWSLLAFISPALLLFVLQNISVQQASIRGLCFGLGFFGVGTSWVYVSIHHFGNANIGLAGFITLLFIFYLALFPTIVCVTASFVLRTSKTTHLLWLFPTLWTLSEWLRGWLFTGFPWLFLGDSQVNTALAGFAPIVGVYGVSWIIVLISVCLFFIFYRRQLLYVLLITGIYGAGTLLTTMHWTTPLPNILQVSIVQGNIAQSSKWDPEHLLAILQIYYKETKKHWHSSSIMIWPEAAIPAYPQQVSFFLQKMQQEANTHHLAIITGVPLYYPTTQRAYNGMIVLGNGQGTYRKRHLVPFGEYIPLKSFYGRFMQYFNIPLSDLSQGPLYQAPLTADQYIFAPFICYEIAYPGLVLNSSYQAQFIVVISDDSWFGKSMASAQQLQIAQMRALETGRAILYSSNTGITAIINPQGKIQQVIPKDRQMVLTGSMTPVTGQTPLMRWHRFLPGSSRYVR